MNRWDNKASLRDISQALSTIETAEPSSREPKILIVQAGQDELVPLEHGVELQRLCSELKLDVERKVVAGTLHTEVMGRAEGRSLVARHILSIA